MRLSVVTGLLANIATSFTAAAVTKAAGGVPRSVDATLIKPKVFIISMFVSEANVWYDNDNAQGSIGSFLVQNITAPGFSPLYPDAHCISSNDVCQLTTGESEINAASSISALVYSNLFDLTDAYFFIAGIAGINPKQGTLSSVAFSKYAIQVALQYELDAREMPLNNFSTGYFPQGASMDANQCLLANDGGLELNDADAAKAYREHYSVASVEAYLSSTSTPYTPVQKAALLALAAEYVPATAAPSVISCDTAASDVYFSGVLLGEAFENTTKLFTNGSRTYYMTGQEDNATLEVLLRAALHKLVGFSRIIIIMRIASDFDRPYPGLSACDNLVVVDQGSFDPTIQNIYTVGVKVVQGILNGWTGTFEGGVPATNYLGDIFGSLGGTPDFGPGYITHGDFSDPASRMLAQQMTARREMSKHR